MPHYLTWWNRIKRANPLTVLAVLLSASILTITFFAALPFVSQESQQLLLVDEFIPEDGYWDYSLSVDEGSWVIINITADDWVRITLGRYRSEGGFWFEFFYDTDEVLTLYESFTLEIQSYFTGGSRTVRVEITEHLEFVSNNTQVLDTSPWFLLLCFATLVVDVYVIRRQPEDLTARQHLGLVGKLALVMLFPIALDVSDSVISYDSALIGLDIPVIVGQVFEWRIAGLSEVLMIFVLCLPGILFALRLPDNWDESEIVGFGTVAATVTVALSLVPHWYLPGVSFVHLWESLLGLTLALLIFVPLINYRATHQAIQLWPSLVSGRRKQLTTSILVLTFLLPFGWQWVVLEDYSHSYTLWAPLWTATHTGLLSADVSYYLQSTSSMSLITSLLLSGALLLYAYGVVRYLYGFGGKQRAYVYGLLGILLSWIPLELLSFFSAGIAVHIYGTIIPAIPLPVLILIGLAVLLVVSPLEIPEEFIEPRVEAIHLEEPDKNDLEAELEVSGAYLVLSWLRKLRSRVSRKRDESEDRM